MKQIIDKQAALEQRRTFLLEGKTFNIVWFLAWPVLIQMFMHLLVQTVDMKMVGALGAEAVASVGMSMQLIMVMAISAMGMSTGITAAVSYYYGQNNHKGTLRAAGQAVILAVLASGVIMLTVYCASGLFLDWMGAESSVRALAQGYVRVFAAGILFFVGRFTLWAVFQGLGDNRTPLKLDVLTNIFNVAGNYVFIFGLGPIPAFGVSGAAMGTVLAHIVGTSLGFYLLRRKAFSEVPSLRELLKFNRRIMAMILRIGAPAALQMFVQSGANALIFSMVARTVAATYAVSGYSIGLLIFQYAFFPAAAVGRAASTLVGMNLGVSNHRRAHHNGWSCAVIGAVLIGFLSTLIYLFAPQLIAFFVSDPQVIASGVPLVRALALVEPLHAMGMILARAFYVAGETRTPFSISLLSWLFVRVPLAWFLAFQLNLQGPGIWWAIAFSQALAAVLMIWRYRKGVGFNLKLEKEVQPQPSTT